MNNSVIIWLDPNVQNEENTLVFQVLDKYFTIFKFSQFDHLLKKIETIHQFNLITCSSMQDYVYQYLNDLKKIGSWYIYCWEKKNGQKLQQSYEQIDRVFTCPNKLIYAVSRL